MPVVCGDRRARRYFWVSGVFVVSSGQSSTLRPVYHQLKDACVASCILALGASLRFTYSSVCVFGAGGRAVDDVCYFT